MEDIMVQTQTETNEIANSEYALTPGWEHYYEILSPQERKKELEYLLDELPDDGAKEFRRKLYSKRYVDPKNKNHQIDLYLWHMVFLPGVYKKRKFFIFNAKKEIREVQKELFLLDFRPLNDAEKSALYWEIRNAADRYFSTCDSPKYGISMFGMKQPDREQKRKKVCEDVWVISRGMLIHTQKEEEMKIYADAIRDAYFNFDIDAKEFFEEYEKENYKKALKK